ncbi:diacylglycerol/lipid kinase family protein [Rhodoplanes azumiensis]|uniref:Diacylglycerol/lipid kinase family protein n=1 Tax=Rhodoplanes azumiensis TaxID=1897628 RepID=A0ABW5AIR7_9BRAD
MSDVTATHGDEGESHAADDARHPRRVVLIVNARSRRGQRRFDTALRLLGERGFLITAAHAVTDPARLGDVAEAAAAERDHLVVVGGGDGTISTVAGIVAARGEAARPLLGLLPLGTANSFAKALGLPLELDRAVDVLRDGVATNIDLGRLDERWFANAVAIGLAADIARGSAHGSAHLAKRWAGRATYLMVAAGRLARHRPFRCTVAHDGGTSVFDALDLRVANGGWQGGVLVAPDAGLATGDLLVRVIPGPSPHRLLRTWWRALRGVPPAPSDVVTLRTRSATIATDRPRPVSVDGEVVAATPVRVTVAPGALRILLPRERHG